MLAGVEIDEVAEVVVHVDGGVLFHENRRLVEYHVAVGRVNLEGGRRVEVFQLVGPVLFVLWEGDELPRLEVALLLEVPL